ncbi:amidohydrolase family protein [Sphingobacterium anhuiense]|uniref:amidohydrolase family protein n=1 Tax=Sphingobacterium anhuiense TaxID=493780 RepID=UPI003C2EC15A
MHTFDKDCINEWYFIVKFLGEKLPPYLKGNQLIDSNEELDVLRGEFEQKYGYADAEEFYQKPSENIGWEQIQQIFEEPPPTNGLIEHIGEFVNYVIRRFFKVKSQSEVLQDFYDRFALNNLPQFKGQTLISSVLMMDFYNVYKTHVKKSYFKQIEEYNDMAVQKPILPFLAVDPRRINDSDPKQNLFELFIKAFDRKQAGFFFGIKLYPSLGFSPSDYRLRPIYEICQEFQIPIVTHCGGELVSTFDERVEIYEDFLPNITLAPGKNRKEKAFYLNDPLRWKVVLDQYPHLKINFAHFGSEECFKSKDLNGEGIEDKLQYDQRPQTIIELMKASKGVYTDFSFALTSPDIYSNFWEILKSNPIVQERLMFGTDFWVVLFNKGEKFLEHQKHFVDLFKYDDLLFNKIFKDNADRYLFDVIKDQ